MAKEEVEEPVRKVSARPSFSGGTSKEWLNEQRAVAMTAFSVSKN